jgi:glycine cleavage system H protein
MSETPEELFYTKEHEWLRIEGDEVIVGITDHAQDALTDIVYIELPEVGDEFAEMDEFALVESVKSASPIFAPMAGEIIAVNGALEDAPELINQDPYGEGWIIRFKLSNSDSTEGLMSADDYRTIIS